MSIEDRPRPVHIDVLPIEHDRPHGWGDLDRWTAEALALLDVSTGRHWCHHYVANTSPPLASGADQVPINQ